MTEQNSIRIMIVDDHAVVRSGLSAFLMAFDDLEQVGEAASGEEAVDLCGQARPDVVLMDMLMPGMGGVAATQAIREQHPNTQVVILTSFGEQERVQAALKAGAIGYLLKDATAEELESAIRNAVAGLPSLAPEAARALIQATTQPASPGYDLTERELEVLALMIEGLRNPVIAERLVVSQSTVKFHVSSILSKLSATTRTEAVALAVQHNLVN
jgi:NarL family two-component system response regulator LiaR